tara:strand:- start:578 stop:1090 length:513 start_codon:yes stop_codon:yes gene_type:complete
MDKKKSKVQKKNGSKTTKPIKAPTQRRGIKTQQANPSSSNITKNLKGFFNKFLSPLLGTPQTQVYKSAYDLQKAKLEKMRNKVYKKGEKVPKKITPLGTTLYGDGSGRSFKDGGYTPCRNEFDGKILYEGYESNCSQFRKKYNQKFVQGQGFKPTFVDMEKDITGNYILK